MKKLISCLMGGAIAMGMLGAMPALAKADAATEEFDESDIVLAFGSLSDSHIGYGTNHVNLDRALRSLKENSTHSIDALYFHGDQTQGHQTGSGQTAADQENQRNEMRQFIGILQDNFDLTKTAAVITNGNHDTCWDGLGPKDFYDVYNEASGGAVYKFDTQDSIGEVAGANGTFIPAEEGDRDVLVNGYHFLTVEIDYYKGSNSVGPITANTQVWLKNTLDKITKENPNRYVFVSAHAVVPDSVGGSSTEKWEDGTDKEWGDWGGTVELQDFFKENKYPQVILFSGHTHYNINEESAIMQMMDMTFLQGGSTADACSEKGFENTYGSDRSEGQGMLIEADGKGNLRIRRYDFTRGKQINTAWYLTAPKADKSHLGRYTKEARAQAPVFTAAEKEKFDVRELSSDSVKVTYPLGGHRDMVTSHIITVKDANGKTLAFKRILTPFRYYPDASVMPKEYTTTFEKLNYAYPFTVEVVAYDCFGTPSETLTMQMKDMTAENQAAAQAIDGRITALSGATLTEADGTVIAEIRADISKLNYKAREMLTKLAEFETIEKNYYHTFQLTPDASDYAGNAAAMYSIASSSAKGNAKASEYTGATITWTNSSKNNCVGFATPYALDGLHIGFANLTFGTESKVLALLVSGQPRDKYVSGETLVIAIDFSTGALSLGNGTALGQSDLLKYDALSVSPFSVRFVRTDGGFTFTVNTLQGEASFEIAEAELQACTHLTGYEACFVSLSPWERSMTAAVDVVSVHDGSVDCKEFAAEPDPGPADPDPSDPGDEPGEDEPGDEPGGDPGNDEGGCGSVAGAGAVMAALAAGAVAVSLAKKKKDE